MSNELYVIALIPAAVLTIGFIYLILNWSKKKKYWDELDKV
jgi:nitrogen fixation-related uncharacterized protein